MSDWFNFSLPLTKINSTSVKIEYTDSGDDKVNITHIYLGINQDRHSKVFNKNVDSVNVSVKTCIMMPMYNITNKTMNVLITANNGINCFILYLMAGQNKSEPSSDSKSVSLTSTKKETFIVPFFYPDPQTCSNMTTVKPPSKKKKKKKKT
ncbi:hypothetical protein RF11_10362 [Thelohanellus kitauei]|uniref:Uncharacterized protein n=1 Tax=Thelohanellus kitauei TaxID=669202 RepID=A0A0C2J003_THEKT|nr:hypothetical protein RF11_10362 [Thelohanellus kitauei]